MSQIELNLVSSKHTHSGTELKEHACGSISERPEEGDGLDAGASGVIAPTEGGLKPVAKGRERAGRGGGHTPQQQQQKSRAAAAVRARSAAAVAGVFLCYFKSWPSSPLTMCSGCPQATCWTPEPKTTVGAHAPVPARTQGPVSASEMLVIYTRHITCPEKLTHAPWKGRNSPAG
jgi:hypothetical protein